MDQINQKADRCPCCVRLLEYRVVERRGEKYNIRICPHCSPNYGAITEGKHKDNIVDLHK